MLADSTHPDILFKYKRLWSNRSQQTIDDTTKRLIQLGEIYFAHSSELNDPYENVFNPFYSTLVESKQNRNRVLLDILYELYPDDHPNTVQKRLPIYKRDVNRDGTLKNKLKLSGIKHNQDFYGICSLTSNERSLPMWSYYGDSHNGICIGIKRKFLLGYQLALQDEWKKRNKQFYLAHFDKVRYVSELPKVDLSKISKINDDGLGEVHYTKSIEWQHEDEYRLSTFGEYSFAYPLGADSIDKVILGQKCTETDVDLVKGWLSDVKSNATLYQTKLSLENYELLLVQI